MKSLLFLCIMWVAIGNDGYAQNYPNIQLNPYIPVNPVGAEVQVGMYMQHLYDSRKQWIQNSIFYIDSLNSALLKGFNSEGYTKINNQLYDYLHKLNSTQIDFSDDNNYNQIVATFNFLLKEINDAYEAGSDNTANGNTSSIPFDHDDVIEWRKKLNFIPKYLTIDAFNYILSTISDKAYNQMEIDIHYYNANNDYKAKVIDKMDSFWDYKIGFSFIASDFEAYYIFYQIDKAGYDIYLKKKAEGINPPLYPSAN